MKIYTDGSCKPTNPGFCGSAAVVIKEDEIIFEISKYLGSGTNNIAELTAIELALDYLLLEKLDWESNEIYTDSKYALGVLTLDWKPNKNQELISSIRKKLELFPNTSIIWVKGHNKDKYNERADELANQCIDKEKDNVVDSQ